MIGKRLKYFVKPSTGEKISFLTKQYFVFPDGRIWNHDKRRFLKQTDIQKYMNVALRDDNGKQHSTIKVHNLVASCFIRLLERGEVVHHINHVRSDNRLENLQIIDAKDHVRMHTIEKWRDGTMAGNSEKMRKAWRSGRMDEVSEKFRNVGISRPAKKVAQLSLDGRLINVWPSTAEGQRNRFYSSDVSKCCRNCYMRPGNNVYKGYRWQYLECYLAQQPTPQQQWESRQIYLDLE